MKMQEIKKIAKTKGLLFRNARKSTIIRTIQRSEGHNDCFGTAQEKECCVGDCIWKEDCLDHVRTNNGSDGVTPSYTMGAFTVISAGAQGSPAPLTIRNIDTF